METIRDFFGGAPKSLQMVTAAMKLKDAYGWFMLRFDRKQQNSVKQLFFNKR